MHVESGRGGHGVSSCAEDYLFGTVRRVKSSDSTLTVGVEKGRSFQRRNDLSESIIVRIPESAIVSLLHLKHAAQLSVLLC